MPASTKKKPIKTHKERIELALLDHTSIKKFEQLLERNEVASVYIKVNLSTISKVRSRLVELNYTTRLFIHLSENGTKTEYIFGRLKGGKGVFNEFCKNTVFRRPLIDLIKISSAEQDVVAIDNHDYITSEDRTWTIL